MTLRTLPNPIPDSDAARFRKFVPEALPDDCWEWQSTKNNRGYGKFWLNGKTNLAHRVSFKIHKGEIPAGLIVRHACDNPPCVNPAHLSIGTVKDNAQDAIDRGHYRRGIDNPCAKLSVEQVSEIKQSWAIGETQVSMARRFGVSRAAIQWVLSGHTWAHVGGAA